MKISTLLALVLSCLALLPRAAKAVDDEQGRKACMNDVMLVCAQYIPDRQRITGCLMSNRNRISAPCRLLITSPTSAH